MVERGLVHKSRVVASCVSAIEPLCRELLDDVTGFGFDEDEVFGIHLAVEEAFANAVKHGNKADEHRSVSIEYFITPVKVDISISDEGAGFAPEAVPDPRTEENLYNSGGRGLLLMRSHMDVVEHNDKGNCVHMIKYRANAQSDEVKE
ncbi:MAG: ATP-binding protein [Planctomycetota bacterium]|nr:MAG: ATP-binding protein [Planctomycetota bacterium]